MPTLIEQISQKLPQAPESLLQQVLVILDSVGNHEESSELETDKIRNHSAFRLTFIPHQSSTIWCGDSCLPS
jgi:hypothetical protein